MDKQRCDLNPAVPFSVNYGQVLVFNGVDFLHGNRINDTGQTRVSMDFRICEEANFIPNDKATLNSKKRMEIGGYFEKI